MTEKESQSSDSGTGSSLNISPQSRRSMLRRAGVLGGAGMVGSTAGCTSGDGGDGSSGDGSSGDGSSGDGSSGDGSSGGQQTTNQTQNKKIELAIPPLGFYALAFNWLEEEGVKQQVMDEYGYDLTLRKTWEDATLYAANKVGIGSLGPQDLAAMGKENDEQHVMGGALLYPVLGWLTKKGGQYDPENTGGTEQTLQKIIDDNAKVAVGSWSGGSVFFAKFMWDQLYGMDFSEGGDFKIAKANFEAVCDLLKKDQIALGESSPGHGCVGPIMNDEVSALYWETNHFADSEFGIPLLGGVHARQSFVDENPGALEGATKMWWKAFDHVHSNLDQYKEDPATVEALPVDTQEEAKFTLEWFFQAQHGINEKIVRQQIPLTEQDVEDQTNVLNAFADAGGVPSDWQDYVSFETYDLSLD